MNRTRVLRCIVFLAGGDIKKLKETIEVAVKDPRDVMFWAEYDKHDFFRQSPERIRDFDKPFDSYKE